MWCCKRTKHPDNIVAMASILTLGGVLPLVGAYLSQILFDLRPCHFCMLERYPYGVLALLGLGLLVLPRMGLGWRVLVALGALSAFSTGLLGLVHTGIEQKWLHYGGGCVAQAAADGSLEALRAAIMAAPLVSCSEVTASLFGLSMASWNSVWALLVLLLIALQYRFEWRRYVATRTGA